MIKKIGENRQGPIRGVFKNGELIGTVGKWHGLFVAEGRFPVETLREAVEQIEEEWAFNNDLPWIGRPEEIEPREAGL